MDPQIGFLIFKMQKIKIIYHEDELNYLKIFLRGGRQKRRGRDGRKKGRGKKEERSRVGREDEKRRKGVERGERVKGEMRFITKVSNTQRYIVKFLGKK